MLDINQTILYNFEYLTYLTSLLVLDLLILLSDFKKLLFNIHTVKGFLKKKQC